MIVRMTGSGCALPAEKSQEEPMTFRKPPLFRTAAILFAACAAFANAGYNFFDPSIPDSIPKLISGTGMYKNILGKELTPDIVYFDVNAPLWTDGAFKQRYIAVPPGQSVIYADTADRYKYPDRSMIIKNFSVDTIPGNTASRILFETRFSGVKIVGGKEKWFLWTYRWRLDQTDADLVSEAGANATVRVYPNGVSAAPVNKKWRFPSLEQCAACHRVKVNYGRVALAFFTAQINRPMAGNPSVNQLKHFFDIGLLKTAVAGSPAPDFSLAPKWARWDDNTASLDLRARSYIAANCSGCHGAYGVASGATAPVELDYDFHDMKPHSDFTTARLSRTFPVDTGALVVPGRPDRSVILYRQIMRNQKVGNFNAEPMAMPPLGSFEPDTNAIAMMSQWITAMPSGLGLHGIAAHMQSGMPAVANGRIILPDGWMDGKEGVLTLADLNGRAVPLARVDKRTWRIEGKAGQGMHLLLWNGKVAAKLML